MSLQDQVLPASYGEIADVIENLGMILRETRRARRITMRTAADQIDDVDYTTLSRIENGKQGGSWRSAVAILRWLDTPPKETP